MPRPTTVPRLCPGGSDGAQEVGGVQEVLVQLQAAETRDVAARPLGRALLSTVSTRPLQGLGKPDELCSCPASPGAPGYTSGKDVGDGVSAGRVALLVLLRGVGDRPKSSLGLDRLPSTDVIGPREP